MSTQQPKDHIDTLIQNWHEIKPGKDFSDMELATRLWRTATSLMKHIQPVFHNAGLNPGEFDVLATLYRNGGRLSPTELYQRLLITSGAMTNRLDTLSHKGLILRTPDPEDKRSIQVTLSADGIALFEPLLETYLKQLETSLSSINPDKRKAMNQAMRTLLLSLEQNQ